MLSPTFFGKEVRNQRRLLKLTLREAAASIPISTSYLALIEAGRALPARETAEKIVEALCFGEKLSRYLLATAALEKGSRIADEELPRDIRSLIYEIRQRSSLLPSDFVAALRTSVRGAANLNHRKRGDDM